MKTIFFKNAQDFRDWLTKNHDKETEIGVGFYKKDSGKTGISYPESVEQALCFGWIDGVGRRIDDKSHMNRFTPRKKKSIWSIVNIDRVKKLTKDGLMTPAGMKAFEAREEKKTGVYSFEQKDLKLSSDIEKRFRAQKKAWQFFDVQTPSYKRAVYWWLQSAKKDETREKRFLKLCEDSSAGRTVRQFTPMDKRR